MALSAEHRPKFTQIYTNSSCKVRDSLQLGGSNLFTRMPVDQTIKTISKDIQTLGGTKRFQPKTRSCQ
jgi:hypothetical protein